MEITKILQMEVYELTDEEEVSVIKNWLGREACNSQQLYECRTRNMQNFKSTVLYAKAKFHIIPQPIVLSLWYCKLKRKSHESAQEWMTADFEYSEYNRRLIQLSFMIDEGMIGEILREILASENSDDLPVNEYLYWLKGWRPRECKRRC